MVGLVLVSHSHALARAVQQMVVSMTGEKLPLAIAAGAGADHAELGTNGVEIMEAINAVMSDDGVLVLMDMGSALLSTETALGFLDVAQRPRVRCSAAPFVEGAVAAGVAAGLGSSLEEVWREAENALRHKAGHLRRVDDEAPREPSSGTASKPAAPSQTIRLILPNPHGLHARPAARFIRDAGAHRAEIQVRNITRNRGPASARSLTSLASLEVQCGDEIEISASGPEAGAALRALQQSVESGLGDSLAAPPPADDSPPDAPAHPPIPVSGGLALGRLFFATTPDVAVPEDRVDDAANEIRKLHTAIDHAKGAVARQQTALRASIGPSEAEIFGAQALLLDDPELIRTAESSIDEKHENAALAWWHAYQAVAVSYEQLEDESLRQRAADVRDIGAGVLESLGVARPPAGDLPEPGILVIEDLTPGEVTALSEAVVGVICLQGGKTSHAAILLRARGIPAIARAKAAFERAGVARVSGRITAAFDGDTGELWTDPDPAVFEALRTRLDQQRRAAADETRRCHERAITTDGRAVAIFANLGHAGEAAAALERGAEGVGLFRTEFLFLDRDAAPGEEEQYALLCRLREVMGTRPAVIRTLDIGGDKDVPYLDLPREANPFLGVRGIRLCLNRREFFRTHLRAILRAGHGGDFRIMFPMITEAGEVREARAAVDEAHQALEQTGTPHAWPIPIGIMVEVPSAVVLIDQLAVEADFFSIGTNDLTQYVLAADRGNPELTHFQDALHPAVLRLIQQVVTAGHHHGKRVAVCGEAAADPAAARLFVGLGVDELSLTPARIPKIKAALCAATERDLRFRADQAINRASAEEARQILAG